MPGTENFDDDDYDDLNGDDDDVDDHYNDDNDNVFSRLLPLSHDMT